MNDGIRIVLDRRHGDRWFWTLTAKGRAAQHQQEPANTRGGC
jgi:hypothetical protein